MFPRPSLRTVVIGVAVAAIVVAGAVALGKYLEPAPLPQVQVASAADACQQFWELQNSRKSIKEMKAGMRAIGQAVEPFDSDFGSRLNGPRGLARRMPPTGLGKLADGVYRTCVNEHDWPPPTQEIADMREPPERSAN